jgi:hypothetical protein
MSNSVNSKSKSPAKLVVTLLVIAVIGIAGFLMVQKNGDKKSDSKANNSEGRAKAEDIYAKVQKIWVNPHPEELPDVKEITDVNKVMVDDGNDVELYKDAKAGDFRLRFKSRKMIYRESENKIIALTELIYAPVSKVSPTPATSTTPTPSPSTAR